MARISLFMLIAAFALAPAAVSADQKVHGAIAPDQLVWNPADPNHPDMMQIAVLYGDPSKPGPVAARVKIPAGLELPSHTHSQAEFVTVLSGKAKVAWGMKMDPMMGEDLGPGSFFWMQAGDHHSLKAIDDLVIELHSNGPLDMVVDK